MLPESRGGGKERAADVWGLERGFFPLGAREARRRSLLMEQRK